MVRVRVRIEGYSELDAWDVSVPGGTSLPDLVRLLPSLGGETVRRHLYDSRTGRLAVHAAAVNGALHRLEEAGGVILNEGDDVIILSPLGGG